MRREHAILVMLAGCFHPQHEAALTAPLIAHHPDERERETAPPANWEFDRSAAIAYALTHGPSAENRRDQEAIAEARIGAAKQLTNPELHLGQTTDQDLLVGNQSRFVVAFRVFPEMPWALDAKISQARANAEAERAVTTTAVRALTAQIEQLYAQLAFGAKTHEILVAEGAVLTERRRVLTEQLAHNSATRLEVMLADQDGNEILATISAIELAAVREQSQLAHLIGLPPSQAWKPIFDLAAERAIRTEFQKDALEARALNRPELAELVARTDAAEAGVYQEKTKRIPWIDSLQIERSVRDTVEWAASASISLPLFSMNSGRIEAAEAMQHQLTDQRHRLAMETVRQVDDAIALATATGKRAKELDANLAPASAELTELFAAEKSAAVSDPVKLLLLEERHVRAQRAMLDAAYDHRMAVIALEALVGGEP